MEPIEKLLALEEIRTLKHRWWRAIDHKDEQLFRSVLADDFVGDFRGALRDSHGSDDGYDTEATSGILEGGDLVAKAVIDTAKASFAKSSHQGSVPDIEFTGENTATGIWPMVDHVVCTPDQPNSEITGYGFYHETYERIDGAWKVKTSRLERVRMDFVQNKSYRQQ